MNILLCRTADTPPGQRVNTADARDNSNAPVPFAVLQTRSVCGPRKAAVRCAARFSLTALAAVLLLSGAGCSTFNRDWKEAAPKAVPANDIQGRWEGTWLSQTKGHHGSLRCLLSKRTDDQYDARFHAKFWKIFSFGYTVPLIATNADGAYQFRGDADLGRLAGGLYDYEGRATPTNFFSTYRSKADHGIFQMQRPAEK